LALAAGQLGRTGVLALGKSDRGKSLRRPLPPLSYWNSCVEQPVGDVVERNLVLGEEELLEHEPDAAGSQRGELTVIELADVELVDPDLALVWRSSVPMTCSRVDLPEPEGPTIATSSPRRTERDTPRRAGTGGASL
jgi:hypothetical protein